MASDTQSLTEVDFQDSYNIDQQVETLLPVKKGSRVGSRLVRREKLKIRPNYGMVERSAAASDSQGLKLCPGLRWANLQQAIIEAFALAMYKWSPCDKDGKRVQTTRGQLGLWRRSKR